MPNPNSVKPPMLVRLSMVLTLSAAPGHASELGAIASLDIAAPGDEQPTTQAYAEWSLTQDGRPSVFFAEGIEFVDASGAEETLGHVGVTRCIPRSCLGAGFLKATLGPSAFDVSPDLGTAGLALWWDRTRLLVEWEEDGAPEVGIGDPAEGEAAASRPAAAEGRVFRTRIRKRIEERYGRLARGTLREDEARGEDPGRISVDGTLQGLSLGGTLPGYRGEAAFAPSNTDECLRNTRPERRFRYLINKERLAIGENKLRLDTELSKVARRHTKEMIRRAKLYHTTADQFHRRVTFWKVLGENVGVGGTVSSLHDAFVASAPHLKNILYPTFRHVGVGVKRADKRMWVTVIFESRSNPGTTLRCPGT